MITNIIKNLIKDIPSVANLDLRQGDLNIDQTEITFYVGKITIVLTNLPQGVSTSVDTYKKRQIVQAFLDSVGEPIQILSDRIDAIINSDIILWDMQD